MFFAAAILAAAAHAAEAFWFTDYQAAAKQASAENRPMLLDFTGSDWCPWCIKLDQEVYSQPTFIDFARQHLVLVKLDFPRQKQLPVAEKNQNRTLAKKFDVHGYPTSVLLDAQGNKLGQYEGYMEGGPHAYIEWVESLKK
ncbi:MAG TPA: thioredoxin fold domain-containing protein [Opitutaceae bacterium]|nr:thioredoxin fold domain-containing protein [Opitutaceae bacterium]